MGMFDYVNVVVPCPYCGKDINSFQTKNAVCRLTIIDPDEISNFYSECKSCGKWVEYNREFNKEKPSYRKIPYNEEEIAALGFKLDFTMEKPFQNIVNKEKKK